ncbi:MAG: saccharopine dehydrogenase NADP-binding domain-containing protein, partial [Pseudomonadales bacterium]|nr:saccharopine dehydrogenase NADP-binding domain-containing protein [Pseudomonadales bacterium]
MPNRILLFGATGYTGSLTAKALVKFGAKPLLVGRNRHKLEKLAKELGGLAFAEANIEDINSLSQLLNSGDILITTVGPFTRYGETALQAAIEKKAHYIDSTGEPGFIRKVFEHYGQQAKEQNITLLTAMGYDYVPGNCAAAVALNMDESATRVDVGYFVSNKDFTASQGTQASITQAMLEPGVFFRQGCLVEKMADAKVKRFTICGRTRPAASVPGSEHLSLPHSYPRLQEVNTYLGWFGNASYLMPLFSSLHALLFKIPIYFKLLDKYTQKLNRSEGKGPDEKARQDCATEVQAITYNNEGRALSEATLLGANPYEFTADMLALSATEGLKNGYRKTGAQGPVAAFGCDKLIAVCEQSGLRLSTRKL